MKYKEIISWLDENMHNNYYFEHLSMSQVSNARKNFNKVFETFASNVNEDKWSKEDYLEWVKLWKDTYKAISLDSRMSKNCRKSSIYGDSVSSANIAYVEASANFATYMLIMLKRAKECAEQSYQNLKVKNSELVNA
jgi:hypothetical protein